MPVTEEFRQKIKELLKTVLAAEPDFYRKKYLSAGLGEEKINTLDESSWNSVPILTKEEISRTPYKNRCYGEGSGLNKLIFCEATDEYILLHRTLEEIRQEKFTLMGERPMVIMADVYEAIERCLYFYENKLLPLIGEFHNSAVIYATARQYEVDALFIDHSGIAAFREKLLEILPGLKSVTVIDSAFAPEDLKWPEKIILNFSLSIPEIGSIAHACPESIKSGNLVFHPADDVYIEPSALSVVSTYRLKACPMIRYKSALFSEKISGNCRCGKMSFRM